MLIKVLISGAGGDVGQGVMKALRLSNLNIEIYATCISQHSSWLHQEGIKGYISPYSDSEDYVPWLINFIRKFKISVFFPTVDSEITKISVAKQFIEAETGCNVFVDNPDRVAICDDKFRTVEYLRDNGFPFPDSVISERVQGLALASRIGYPLIVKKKEVGVRKMCIN